MNNNMSTSSNNNTGNDDLFLGGQRIFEHTFSNSSTISKIIHDSIVDSMEVQFVNGSVYRYYEINRKTARRLANADSAGIWFTRYIRNHYQYTVVSKAPSRAKNSKNSTNNINDI